MKGGVTAIGIGLALVVVWMWGAQTEMPAPEARATAPATGARDAPKDSTAAEPSAPSPVASARSVVATPATPQPDEHPATRSVTGLLSPPITEPVRAPEPMPVAEPVARQPVEPAPPLSAETVGSTSRETTPAPAAPETLAPEAPTVAVSPPTAAPGSADDAARAGEIAAIQEVLNRYKRMYDQLDASEAASIWPSVDSRALTRMFSRLDRQTLEFEGCVFGLWENGAAADCTGWLSYVPRVGTARREPHAWTIELTRGDEGWRILKVIAR